VDNFVDRGPAAGPNPTKNQGLGWTVAKNARGNIQAKSTTYERYGFRSGARAGPATWLRRNTVFVHKSRRAPDEFQLPVI
jgi:hypothetical protein